MSIKSKWLLRIKNKWFLKSKTKMEHHIVYLYHCKRLAQVTHQISLIQKKRFQTFKELSTFQIHSRVAFRNGDTMPRSISVSLKIIDAVKQSQLKIVVH